MTVCTRSECQTTAGCKCGQYWRPAGHAVSDQSKISRLEGDVAKMRAALQDARYKLQLYREAHGAQYLGGVEYGELMKRIDAVLR